MTVRSFLRSALLYRRGQSLVAVTGGALVQAAGGPRAGGGFPPRQQGEASSAPVSFRDNSPGQGSRQKEASMLQESPGSILSIRSRPEVCPASMPRSCPGTQGSSPPPRGTGKPASPSSGPGASSPCCDAGCVEDTPCEFSKPERLLSSSTRGRTRSPSSRRGKLRDSLGNLIRSIYLLYSGIGNRRNFGLGFSFICGCLLRLGGVLPLAAKGKGQASGG